MTMALTWQQGPFGTHPTGRLLTDHPLPEHVLYAEPAGRRMRIELAGAAVATSDDVVLLHETGRYPVAYFPHADVDARLLRPSGTRSDHPVLGETAWWSLEIDGQRFTDAAWSHPAPPSYPAAMGSQGVARYYDVVAGRDRAHAAAWSYPSALPESLRIEGYISFDPALTAITLDGERLLAAAHQAVRVDGTDRGLMLR